MEIQKPEIIERLKLIELKGIQRRIMFVLLNNREKWLSGAEIFRLITKGYLSGTLDHRYSLNRCYMALRELHGLDLIERHETKGQRGMETRYRINAVGVEQLGKNIERDNNNIKV